MDDIEKRADEMLRYMKLCPKNGVTERDVAIAYLRLQHSAGKVDATQQVGERLFANVQ